MKVSYNWLKDYLEFNTEPEELGKILTQTGLEVESIESKCGVKGGLQGVVVGLVTDCQAHPDADKLKITQINIGQETLQIVCGAPNVSVGQKVPVALVGTTIYPTSGEPLTLKAAKIRGVQSQGMICAEDELGLGSSHAGIMVLPDDFNVGESLASALDLDIDYTIEIGLTPNRSDAMGHIGVVRDLKAYWNFHENKSLNIKWPETVLRNPSKAAPLTIEVSEPEFCERYFGAKITGVSVKPSPDWLQKRLLAVGSSPINNIVDITNFVMRELGTPLHAFDAQHFDKTVHVRFARTGEVLRTLDQVDRTLSDTDLVIANENQALCLAGVMGGQGSGVHENTTDVFLESAYFDAANIRKTAKRHGINSESSFRFERGVDPELTLTALNRAIDLIIELAGGQLDGGISAFDSGVEAPNKTIELTTDEVNRKLGTQLSEQDISKILTNLDFLSIGPYLWKAPAYRTDVSRPADVIEEIIRIYGFDKVPLPHKWNFSLEDAELKTEEQVKNQISNHLVAKGFREVMNNSLTKSAFTELLHDPKMGAPVLILNPLSTDLNTLRNSMFYGLLENIEYNQNRQQADLLFFEYGNTYHLMGSKHIEKSHLALTVTGHKKPESWHGTEKTSFFALKGLVHGLLQTVTHLDIEELTLSPQSTWSMGIEFKIKNKTIAIVGLLNEAWSEKAHVKSDVFAALIDWKSLVSLAKGHHDVFEELPKAFEVRRDYSLLLDEHIEFSSMKLAAVKACSGILKSVRLFDVYQGKNLQTGKKSYAISFHFQHMERTLTDEEVEVEMKAIITAYEKQFEAVLR